jgi:nucleoid DNA-binding protein
MTDATTITKAELSDALFDQVGLNKREAKDLIDAFFETISTSLAQGVDVKISGFGNFHLREKSARPGRNPFLRVVSLHSTLARSLKTKSIPRSNLNSDGTHERHNCRGYTPSNSSEALLHYW